MISKLFMRTDIKLRQKLLWPETNTINFHSFNIIRTCITMSRICIMTMFLQCPVLGGQAQPGHGRVRRADGGAAARHAALHRAQPRHPRLVLRHALTQVAENIYCCDIVSTNSCRLLARCSRQYEKVTDVSCLRSRFESLSQCNNITMILAMDNFAHKQIGQHQFSQYFRRMYIM